MLELFRILGVYGLTANQYHVLLSIKEGISTPLINQAKEFRSLGERWINPDKTLTIDSLNLIEEVESLVGLIKKKASKSSLGSDADEYIEKYREMWSMGQLPSGIPAKVNKKDIEAKFQKFFNKYPGYTWDEILQATDLYIDEYSHKTPAFIYMRNSSYFIMKANPDKSQESALANYIDMIRNNEYLPQNNNFKDNVV